MPAKWALVHKGNLYILSTNAFHLLTTLLLFLSYFKKQSSNLIILPVSALGKIMSSLTIESTKNNIITFQFVRPIVYIYSLLLKNSLQPLRTSISLHIEEVLINSQWNFLYLVGPNSCISNLIQILHFHLVNFLLKKKINKKNVIVIAVLLIVNWNSLSVIIIIHF